MFFYWNPNVQLFIDILYELKKHHIFIIKGLPLKSKNLFVEVIDFALQNNKELLYTIVHLTKTNSSEFDASSVISVATLFMDIASRINPKSNVLKKIRGVVLQACGLNETGLQILSKLGDSIGPRSLLNLRTELAIKDEHMVKYIAKTCGIAIAFDNLDRKVNRVLQHQSLPVLLCRDIPEYVDQLDNVTLSLEQVMSKFTTDYFLLDNPCQGWY